MEIPRDAHPFISFTCRQFLPCPRPYHACDAIILSFPSTAPTSVRPSTPRAQRSTLLVNAFTGICSSFRCLRRAARRLSPRQRRHPHLEILHCKALLPACSCVFARCQTLIALPSVSQPAEKLLLTSRWHFFLLDHTFASSPNPQSNPIPCVPFRRQPRVRPRDGVGLLNARASGVWRSKETLGESWHTSFPRISSLPRRELRRSARPRAICVSCLGVPLLVKVGSTSLTVAFTR